MFEIINLDYLNSILEDDAETKETMLTMLLVEIPDEIKKINDAHLSNDITTLKNAAHKLKSTLAFIGNKKLIETNIAIEQIAKSNDGLEQLPHLIKIMNDLEPQVIREVKLAVDAMQK